DDNPCIGGIKMDNIKRFTSGDPNTAALADRVMHDAVVAAERTPVNMDNIARIGRFGLQLGDNVRIFALRHEADVLAILLLGDGQAHFLRDFAHLGLRQMTEREAQIINLLLRGGEKEIALVAIRVDRTIKRAMRAIGAAANIVAGRQRIGTEIARGLQEIGEFYRLIARNAWDRRFAAYIGIRKRIDHGLAEARFVIEDVMRNAQTFRNAAGIFDVLSRAAGTGAVNRCAMVIELQRHANDIVTFTFENPGHNR